MKKVSITRPPRAAATTTTTGTTSSGALAYTAATDSPNRSSFVAFPTNSRRELTPQTRRDLVKKSRALEANCPLLTRIISKFSRHAVGSGIHFRILSDDEAFNDAARRDVEEWWNNAAVYSLDGSIDGWESKRMAVEQILLDGEFNAGFVNTPSGWPMIQTFDVFEIETPAQFAGRAINATEWDDGVRISSFDRPLDFSIRRLPRINEPERSYQMFPAWSMIHLGRRRRARGHRYLPATYSGLNSGIDALDLNSLLAGTLKLHSALAVEVKKVGKVNRKGAINAIDRRTTGDTGTGTDTQALEKVYGSMVNYVGENGEINLKSSNFPGPSQLDALRLLFSEMALGFDVPSSVMISLSETGGTAVRSDMEDAQSAFDMLYDRVAWGFVRREIIWKLSTSIKSGRLAAPRDPAWFSKLVMRGPRKLTVDIGRMAQAFKTLTRNAGMSIPRWFEEQGLDADQEMRDNILFLKRVKQVCEQESVPAEWVYEGTPGAAKAGEGGGGDDSLKSEIDAYGVAVRAGAVTPTLEDEQAFRERLGLPPLPAAAAAAWSEDEGFRRPITLLQKGQPAPSLPIEP